MDLPVFDVASLEALLLERAADTGSDPAVHCKAVAVAECLARTGCLLVRDARVTSKDNDAFLDLLEQYFEQPDNLKAADVRADLHFQVGLTPGKQETPRVVQDLLMQSQVAGLPAQHAATLPTGPDPKCRFMWRIGNRPTATSYPELNAAPVLPQAFPQWGECLDSFGSSMLAVACSVARCLAVGLGLHSTALVQLMQGGPHLLAPTGSDLAAHGALGTVLAGYHADLNLMTLHGRSRFPGLFVWLADGTKAAVKVPEGCVLVQAGQQLEHLTGGHIKAGRHEVVVTEGTVAAMAAARQAGRSLWRVSSTLFTHVASDSTLQPLGSYATPDSLAVYPPCTAGQQVQAELEVISLKPVTSDANTGLASVAGTVGAVCTVSREEGTGLSKLSASSVQGEAPHCC